MTTSRRMFGSMDSLSGYLDELLFQPRWEDLESGSAGGLLHSILTVSMAFERYLMTSLPLSVVS